MGSDVFSSVRDGLHEIWSGYFEVYMNGSLRGAGSANVLSGAVAYFLALDLSVGVRIFGFLSSTMAELQAVALALECVPSSCSVVLYLDSQAAIDACVSEDKNLSVNWVKVKSHASVLGNVRADKSAGKAAGSFYVLPIRASPGWDVVSIDMLGDFDWAASAKVWHPDSHMLAGFTSWKSADLQTYLMKTVHKRLPVAVRKKLYNKCYPGVQCLLCEKMELPDHVFTCSQNVHTWMEILLEVSVCWASLVGDCDPFSSSVLKVLDSCHLDVGRYSVLCKGFVMKSWVVEAAGVFEDAGKASGVVVKFVKFLVELHRSRVWLVRSKFRVNMEKAGLVGDNCLVSNLSRRMCSVLSDSMVRMLGIAEFFAVSFGHCKPCFFFSGLNDCPHVYVGV
ncbi:hypothetical protein G9A89_023250 [Geosiphon pyriformis]|nr:hypothetical protein G9A89_023250 [Geosiphon pyriformis]